MLCERCGGETSAFTTSFFNTQVICLERCYVAERAHPDFERAHRVETEAVKRGDFNFPGIGLPPDLVVERRGGGET